MNRILVTLIMYFWMFGSASDSFAWQATYDADKVQRQKASTSKLRSTVAKAFAATHDGWSSDEVILNDKLNQAFISACQKELPDTDPVEFNWTLLNLRKAGLLKTKATKRSKPTNDSDWQLAEIVARLMFDRHQVSTDRIMSNPELRAEFDKETKKIDPKADTYVIRKAAFGLRKRRRLRPELISRIADWDRTISSFTVDQVQTNSALIPKLPGIYIQG